MASINEDGRTDRQTVIAPNTGTTVGAGWWERVRQTLTWATTHREAFTLARAAGYATGAFESLPREQVTKMDFNTKNDPSDLCDVSDGSSRISIPPGRPRGWWMFTALVDMSGGSGNVGNSPAGTRMFAEIIAKVGDAEYIMARDEDWMPITVPVSLMPHATFNLDAFPADEDVEIEVRAFQNYSTVTGGLNGVRVVLYGMHLHSHTTEISGGALGATAATAATRWTSGSLLATHTQGLERAVQYMWHDRPAIEMYAASTLSVSSGTSTVLSMWGDQTDPRGWSLTTGFTAQQAGWYLISTSMPYDGATNSHNFIHWFEATGALYRGGDHRVLAASRGPSYSTITTLVLLAAGETITSSLFQDSGNTWTVGARWDGASFIGRWSAHLVQLAPSSTDTRGLPAAKACNDIVSQAEVNQLIDTANWAARSRPFFYATASGGQTLSSGLLTVLNFNTEVADLGGVYNPANGRFTAPISGWYILGCSAVLPDVDATPCRWRVMLVVNGVTTSPLAYRTRISTVHVNFQLPPIPVHLNAGEFVDVRASYFLGSSFPTSRTTGNSGLEANRYSHRFYGWLETAD